MEWNDLAESKHPARLGASRTPRAGGGIRRGSAPYARDDCPGSAQLFPHNPSLAIPVRLVPPAEEIATSLPSGVPRNDKMLAKEKSWLGDSESGELNGTTWQNRNIPLERKGR